MWSWFLISLSVFLFVHFPFFTLPLSPSSALLTVSLDQTSPITDQNPCMCQWCGTVRALSAPGTSTWHPVWPSSPGWSLSSWRRSMSAVLLRRRAPRTAQRSFPNSSRWAQQYPSALLLISHSVIIQGGGVDCFLAFCSKTLQYLYLYKDTQACIQRTMHFKN